MPDTPQDDLSASSEEAADVSLEIDSRLEGGESIEAQAARIIAEMESEIPIEATINSEASTLSTKLSTFPDDPQNETALHLITEEHIPLGLKAFPPPDSRAVMRGCNRIQELLTNEHACEYQFKQLRQGLMTVIGNLESGRERVHNLLSQKPGYEEAQTNGELEEAMEASGPMYCEHLNARCGGQCERDCSYWMTSDISSPIKITGENYLSSKLTGFWNVQKDKQGNVKRTTPNYDDLRQYFEDRSPYFTNGDNELTHTYNGTHWDYISNINIKSFPQSQMSPKPFDPHCREFLSLIKRTNLKSGTWFYDSTDALINLKNGVFNVRTGEIMPHSEAYGFRYTLPYDYDEGAKAPRFEQFLKEVTLNDPSLSRVLLEFMGYAIAGGPCYAEKALFLYGVGRNGKSVFMEMLKDLAGRDNYSSLSLTALNKDTKRYAVDGKLFNIGEETSARALGDSEVFKAMVTGGEIDVKKLYAQDYIVQNRCKLIMACNELPKSSDRSDGLYRRMIIVPFRANFDDRIGNRDPYLREKLYQELPGIFNLVVEGYRRLTSNKYQFSQSLVLDQSMEEYREENDNVLQWLNENVQVRSGEYKGFEFWEYTDTLYKDYQGFCAETGNFAVAKVTLIRNIAARYGELVKVSRRMNNAKRGRAFEGLKLTRPTY